MDGFDLRAQMVDEYREFEGTERFEVQRRLGAGAFGAVYQVLDRKREAILALKTLHRTEPAALYRFKREFRVLADHIHPNLVTRYELMSDRGQWYFTMELIRGVEFREFIRGERSRGSEIAVPMLSDGETLSLGGREQSIAQTSDGIEIPALSVAGYEVRMRSSLTQLVEGISELHRYGILHRDIKPSNVLVTAEGRVVLLDFGLATEFASAKFTDAGHVLGTPAYMSPEQAFGEPLTEASDWYSVGIVLYEVLTGVLPYSGGVMEILQAKRTRDPVPPSELNPDIPGDLDELCRDLLNREAAKRPHGEEVLQRILAASTRDQPEPERLLTTADASPFVGREAHLAELSSAYERMKQSHPVAVLVHGQSGIGKTALVRNFLERLQKRDYDALVFAGRCYEQESVPYKALDSLVDSLSQYLRQLSRTQVDSLLPRYVFALSRLFPVLLTAESIANAQRRMQGIPDQQELRRRAFVGLKELLGRLAERNPVVLFIDDLQWGDIDSALLLAELLRPPDPPALLVIGCYRSEEAETSPFLKTLLSLKESIAPTTDLQDIEVGQMTDSEARELALTIMGSGEAVESRVNAIVQESRGSPFLINQLVRFRQGRAAEANMLENVVRARVSKLPNEARRLLEVSAVAGQPLSVTVAEKAAGLSSGLFGAMAHLRAAQLIRVRAGQHEREFEPYHDRIRETIVADLSREELREHHHRLAHALEASGHADFEILAVHYYGARNVEKAGHYSRLAASEATDALAFDRAARLYQFALDLQPAEVPETFLLRVKLGEALTNAGRGSEAAQAFLAAVKGASAEAAIDLRRKAAEQLLISGHVDDGIDVLRSVLSSIGMRLPKTPAQTLTSLLLWRIYLGLRGLSYRERSESQIASGELLRIDTCNAVCRGMGLVDTVPSLVFQSRHLLLALRAGEPVRVSRALSFEALSVGISKRGRRRAQKLLAISRSIAERIQHPYALGMNELNSGILAVIEGRWKMARQGLEKASETLRDNCTGIRHELDIIHGFSMDCLFYLGRFVDYFKQLPELLSEAERRGDLYAQAVLGLRYCHAACFAEDDPDGAERQVQRSINRWSVRGFHLQHSTELFRLVEFALYRGTAEKGWEFLRKRWPSFVRSLLLRIQVIRIIALDTRARCALAMAMQSGLNKRGRRNLIAIAEGDAQRIEREGAHWGEPTARCIQAGVALQRDDLDRAANLLSLAETGFQTADMSLHAVVARRRRGELLGGAAGLALQKEADEQLFGQGVKKPAEFSKVLAPGPWGRC